MDSGGARSSPPRSAVTWRNPRGAPAALLVFGLVGASYAAGSWASFSWFGALSLGATFFPAAGVALAGLVLTPRRLWPVVMVAIVAAEIGVDMAHDLTLQASLGYAGANAAQALVGAIVLTRIGGPVDLHRFRFLVAFIGTATTAPFVGAALGGATFVSLDGGDGWWHFASQWWAGDGLGVLVVGAAILAFRTQTRAGSLSRVWVPLALAVACALPTAAVFWWDIVPLIFLPMVLILVASPRIGAWCVALAGAAVAFVAAEATSQGASFWEPLGASPTTQMLYLQAAIGVVIVGGLATSALNAERERALRLRSAADSARVGLEFAVHQAADIRRLAEQVSRAVTPREVGVALLASARERTGAVGGAVMTLSDDGETMVATEATGNPWAPSGPYRVKRRARGSLAAEAIAATRPVMAQDRMELERRFPRTAEVLHPGVRAALGLPLRTPDTTLGVVLLTFSSPRAVPGRDLAVLEAMSSLCGQALERARLFEGERTARRTAEILRGHATALVFAVTDRDVAQTTVEALMDVGAVRATMAGVSDGSLEVLASIATSGAYDAPELAVDDRHPLAECVRTGTVVARLAARGEWTTPSQLSLVGDPATPGRFTKIALPLRGGQGDIIGAISLLSPDAGGFTTAMRAVLITLAEQAGVALDRVRTLERRRAAEEELEASHRYITDLTALVPGVLYVFDLDEQRTVFANRDPAEVLGYKDDGGTGMGNDFIGALLHPDDRPALQRHFDALRTLGDGLTKTHEYRFRHSDGSWRRFESTDAVFTRGPDGRARQILGIAMDVTERSEAVQRLQEDAARTAFRAELIAALRPLDDPREIQDVANRLVGEWLGADRVHLADVDGEHGHVDTDYRLDGVASVAGSHHLDSYGVPVMNEARRGKTVVLDDVATDRRLGPDERAATLALGARAYVLVPLMREARMIGLFVVHHAERRHWADDEIKLLQEAAEWTRSAVERARSLAALRAREARYRTLFTSIDEGFCLCQIILDADGNPVDYRFLEVNARFEEQTGLKDSEGHTARELVPSLEHHWVETYARAAVHGETVRFEQGSEAMGRWFAVYASPVEPVGSGLFALVFNDITAQKREMARAHEREADERRGRMRAELTASILSELETIQEVRPRMERLVRLLVPAVGDYGSIEAPGEAEPILALAHRDPRVEPVFRALRERHRLDTDAAFSVARAAEGTAQLISEVTPALVQEVSPNQETVVLLKELAPRSHIAVPLSLGRNRTGSLLLGLSAPDRRPYDSGDLEFVRQLAVRVGTLSESAEIHEEARSIALRLQQALLPQKLASESGIQVAAHYEAGGAGLEVGGDWYDAVALADGHLGLTVGDVVGHGLDAASTMGRMRTALAALAPHAEGPGALLDDLDRFAAGPNGTGFATACWADLDPATGVLRYASAGHPPMLAVAPDGTTTWLEDGRSMPLGGFGGPNRSEATVVLEPGATLLLYSDGLVERRGERLTIGLERLENAAREMADLPLEDGCARILREVMRGSAHEDDVVLMCVRFVPVGARRFHRMMPARADELAPTRAAVREWLEAGRVPEPARRHVMLALGEALSNAVEHAYVEGGRGRVEVDVGESDGRLDVRVRDFGRWRPPRPSDNRGRGTPIMEAITEGYERNSNGHGTVVRFSVPTHGEVQA